MPNQTTFSSIDSATLASVTGGADNAPAQPQQTQRPAERPAGTLGSAVGASIGGAAGAAVGGAIGQRFGGTAGGRAGSNLGGAAGAAIGGAVGAVFRDSEG